MSLLPNTDFPSFTKAMLRAIAAGLGVDRHVIDAQRPGSTGFLVASERRAGEPNAGTSVRLLRPS